MVYMHVCSTFFSLFVCTTVQVNDASSSVNFSDGSYYSHHCFVILGILYGLCENRQQLTWILVKKSCERWCTCVCAPHFFCDSHFHELLLKNDDRSQQKTNQSSSRRPTLLFCFLLFSSCARIDNNRREYCEEKCEKIVCMRVCSAFFFGCTTVQVWWTSCLNKSDKLYLYAMQNR